MDTAWHRGLLQDQGHWKRTSTLSICRDMGSRFPRRGVPLVAHPKRTRLISLGMWVWSLDSLSGLKTWHSRELWCRTQTRLGSCMAGWQLQPWGHIAQTLLTCLSALPSLRGPPLFSTLLLLVKCSGDHLKAGVIMIIFFFPVVFRYT